MKTQISDERKQVIEEMINSLSDDEIGMVSREDMIDIAIKREESGLAPTIIGR